MQGDIGQSGMQSLEEQLTAISGTKFQIFSIECVANIGTIPLYYQTISLRQTKSNLLCGTKATVISPVIFRVFF